MSQDKPSFHFKLFASGIHHSNKTQEIFKSLEQWEEQCQF
jgi:hypothetical protein